MAVLVGEGVGRVVQVHQHVGVGLEHHDAAVGQQPAVDAAVVEIEPRRDRAHGIGARSGEPGCPITEKSRLLRLHPRRDRVLDAPVVQLPVVADRQVVGIRLAIDEDQPVLAVVAVSAAEVAEVGEIEVVGVGLQEIAAEAHGIVDARQRRTAVVADRAHQLGALERQQTERGARDAARRRHHQARDAGQGRGEPVAARRRQAVGRIEQRSGGARAERRGLGEVGRAEVGIRDGIEHQIDRR